MSQEKGQIQQEVENLVEKGHYKEALLLLKTVLESNEKLFHTVLLLLGTLARNQLSMIDGAQSREILSTELSQIVKGILTLAGHIQPVSTYNTEEDGYGEIDENSNKKKREKELVLSFLIAEARTKVRSVLLSNIDDQSALSIGELTRNIGMDRKYIAAAVHELEVLELVQKNRPQNRTRFVLNDRGKKLLSKLNN